jgi:two-component sensor histidine kinase
LNVAVPPPTILNPAKGFCSKMSLSRRRYPTRLYLVAFSLALVLPLVALGGVAIYHYAGLERSRLEAQATEIAHQVALILDGDIEEHVALLRGLSTAPALLADDLAAFHAQATRATRGTESIIVLRTFGATQLVNTQVLLGQPLPPAIPLAEDEIRTLRASRPAVSSVYASPISGEPRIAVALAPLPQEKPDYVVAITFPTSRFHASITEGIPRNWIIGVGDRKGTYVSHSTRHAEVSGRPGWPAYLANATGKSGSFYAESATGRRLLAGYFRSDLTGWLVAANIPADILEAPLQRSLIALIGAGLLALSISAAFAYYFSRRLAGSAGALAARAQAVGQGRDMGPLASGVSEFAVVDAALTEAAGAVAARVAMHQKLVEALAQKEMLLKEVNHRVKNSLQLVASLLNLQRSRITDPEAKRQFEDAVRRVSAVAHVHQRLYSDEHLDKVALDRFMADLCRDLNQMAPAGTVKVECTVDPCVLPTDRVIPLALIVNELVANAFKYSFPEGGAGVIRLHGETKPGALVLSVSDDGRPFPAGFDPAQSNGLGMKMIAALARQLRATLTIEPQPIGKRIELHVPLNVDHPAA